MKIYIFTLGCKVNAYESQYMLESCIKAGYTESSSMEEADVVVINSCTVTETSLTKAKKLLNRIRKHNSKAIIVLCGCMPQAYANNFRVENTDNVADIVMGVSNRLNLVKNIGQFLKDKKPIVDIASHKRDNSFENMRISNFKNRSRAFVKIEDGCENYCSYCMIPFARGFVRSKKLEDLSYEIEELSQNGYSEIVLTGINLSAYGKDLGCNLCDAVELVGKNERIKRIRLSSLEVNFLDENSIIRLSKIDKLCPHFHISLQSGCDTVLKRMNRKYTTIQYLDAVKNIRKYFKNSSITTDLIVGFPGETEEEFVSCKNFIKLVGFAKIHVFPYSKREGTLAAGMESQVNPEIKKLRTREIIELSDKMAASFLQTQLGKFCNVLFEKKTSKDIYEGFTENYLHLKTHSSIDLREKIKSVKVTGIDHNFLIGEIENNEF